MRRRQEQWHGAQLQAGAVCGAGEDGELGGDAAALDARRAGAGDRHARIGMRRLSLVPVLKARFPTFVLTDLVAGADGNWLQTLVDELGAGMLARVLEWSGQ